MNDEAPHRPVSRRQHLLVKCASATGKKRIFGWSFVGTFERRIVSRHPRRDRWISSECRRTPGLDHRSEETAICRERPSACVATSMSLSRLSRCSSTCAIVKTASVGQGRHGAAPRTFPRKPSAWMVPTRSIPGRVTPGHVSTTISARLVGQQFAGPERQPRRDLASRLGCSPIPHSRPQRCLSGRRDDTGGRRPWTQRHIGTRNRPPAEAFVATGRQSRQPIGEQPSPASKAASSRCRRPGAAP
jgi:hypothetical protein